MARRLLTPPTVRLAQPEDAAAIRSFRCGHRPWYVQDATKVIRKAASVLGTPAAARETKVLLFEADDRLIAVSIVQQAHEPHTADLVVLAIHEDVQGAWLDEKPPRPLCAWQRSKRRPTSPPEMATSVSSPSPPSRTRSP